VGGVRLCPVDRRQRGPASEALQATWPGALWDTYFTLGIAFYLLLVGPGGRAPLASSTWRSAVPDPPRGHDLLDGYWLGHGDPVRLRLAVGGAFYARSFGQPDRCTADRSLAELERTPQGCNHGAAYCVRWWQGTSKLEQSGAVLIAHIALASVIHALSPPWSFDALVYQLAALRQHLANGRIVFLPKIWQADGPMAIEMLYTFGLSMLCLGLLIASLQLLTTGA
jgi:hypothetical protein